MKKVYKKPYVAIECPDMPLMGNSPESLVGHPSEDNVDTEQGVNIARRLYI